jgi:predicted unusual protein kinase regulating ubiquinone biosynthesis (AarF/ABC1/UbiB family)
MVAVKVQRAGVHERVADDLETLGELAADLGMVGQLSPRLQDQLLALLIAVADRRPDEAAELIIDIGERREAADEAALRRGDRSHRAISRRHAC